MSGQPLGRVRSTTDACCCYGLADAGLYLPSDQRPHDELEQVAVPLHRLFVLGDRRDNSYDSHSWGMLDEALVLGRVVQEPGEWDQ